MIPKFRGRSTVEDNLGEWVYGHLITDGEVALILNEIVEVNDQYVTIGEWCSVDIDTVGQSTGLFDSSLEPVEIYKDDIVTKSLPNRAVLVGVVTFTKGMFLVDGVEAIDQSWVVIGNIHEHPHLLEGLNGG